MKFTEAQLEQVFINLLGVEGFVYEPENSIVKAVCKCLGIGFGVGRG